VIQQNLALATLAALTYRSSPINGINGAQICQTGQIEPMLLSNFWLSGEISVERRRPIRNFERTNFCSAERSLSVAQIRRHDAMVGFLSRETFVVAPKRWRGGRPLRRGVASRLRGPGWERLVYSAFYPAVEVAALLGGITSGAVTTVLCALLAHLWVTPTANHWLRLAIFLTTATVISCITEALHRTWIRLSNAKNRAADEVLNFPPLARASLS
jgi:hypothetical protein